MYSRASYASITPSETVLYSNVLSLRYKSPLVVNAINLGPVLYANLEFSSANAA